MRTGSFRLTGGQGFATDYAGDITSQIRQRLTDPSDIEVNLAQLDATPSDAEYLTNSLFISSNPTAALASLQAILPLPDGRDTSLYFDSNELAAVYTTTELSEARLDMKAAIVERQIEPIRNGTELLPEVAYLTRLYTTLSADEMTVDPTFNYNSSMPEQPLERQAMLNASCDNGTSHWSLTLGEGTGRAGETVLEVSGQPIPGSVLPSPIDDQPAAFLRQRTSADAAPELLFKAELSVLEIAAGGSVFGVGSETDSGSSRSGRFLGAAGIGWFLITGFALWVRRKALHR